MFFAVILYMPKMLKIKVFPSYSGFTFPLVISAIAMQYANSFLAQYESSNTFTAVYWVF